LRATSTRGIVALGVTASGVDSDEGP
jgi:hypothetical protein